MLSVRLLILQSIACVVAAADSQPLWKTLLKLHKDWKGFYHHNGISYICNVHVLSESYVKFSSENINVDMRVFSNNNETVMFKEESTWNSSMHFMGHTNMEFAGTFLRSDCGYYFQGNVSSDEVTDFGTVNFCAVVNNSTGTSGSNRNSNLQYGLAVGIPVTLAVVLMVAGGLILRWGFKSGYLRHVPWAYKHFTNPRKGRTEVDLHDINNQYTGDQAEVHI